MSEQMRLMGECRGSIDAVKRAEGELTEEDLQGLTNPTSTDTQSSGQFHTNSSAANCVTCDKRNKHMCELFLARCDRALGADPGSVSEREAQAHTEPAAADLRSADHEGLAGSV